MKECGVHSVEQLAERHIHSLATLRVQEAQAREVEGQQRVASRLLTASPHNRYTYEHSCTPPLISYALCTKQPFINRLYGCTFTLSVYLPHSTPRQSIVGGGATALGVVYSIAPCIYKLKVPWYLSNIRRCQSQEEIATDRLFSVAEVHM